MLVECLADGGDAAVHHVGRRDDVSAGLSLRDGDLLQEFERLVVVDVMALEMATVAMRRVLAEADIADNHELWHRGLDGLDGALHRARRVPG